LRLDGYLDVELLDSPEIIDLMTQAAMQSAGIAGLDGWKKWRKKIKRGIKRIGRQANRFQKKVVKIHADVATLGMTKFNRDAKRAARQVKRLNALYFAEKDPAKKKQILAQINMWKRRRNKNRKYRNRIIKGVAIVGAAIAAPYAIGALKSMGMSASTLLKTGAAAGKKGALAKIAPFLVKAGMSASKAADVAETMAQYPPDPRLTDPEAMMSDSYMQRANAESGKTDVSTGILGGDMQKLILPVGAGLVALMVLS